VLPIGTEVSPHTFRHSAARHWLAQGVQIIRVHDIAETRQAMTLYMASIEGELET